MSSKRAVPCCGGVRLESAPAALSRRARPRYGFDELNGERIMILPAVLGFSLLTTVAVPPDLPPGQPRALSHLSAEQKAARMQPYIHSANECVLRAIATDPRLARSAEANDFGSLIVESMAPCAETMRAMIDEYDRLFGEGAGEDFFMGPYLDALPAAVGKRVKGTEK
jgi:hypothetical protein